MGAKVKIYRGISGDGNSVAVIAGDFDGLLAEAVEKFAGTCLGRPELNTVLTPIAEIAGIAFEPCDFEERVLKYGEAIMLDSEAERINEMISSIGLNLITQSAEEFVYKAIDEDEEDEEEFTIFAPVLEPNDGEDGAPLDPDKQNEIYSAEAIRKTAHYWMENGGVVGLMHRFNIADQVSVLESYLAPVDFVFKCSDGSDYKVRKGTWLLRLRINNKELWDAIKEGKLGAFSVGGTAIKRTEEISKDGHEPKE